MAPLPCPKPAHLGYLYRFLISRAELECDAVPCRAGKRDSCNVNPIARENCVLRCSSSDCYDETYGSDSLEEGEVDTLRSRSFRTCFKGQLRERKTSLSSTPSTAAHTLQGATLEAY